MIKHYGTLLFFMLGFAFCSFSQQVENENGMPSKDLKQIYLENEGTYQFQMVGTRQQPIITYGVINEIVSLRHETDTVIHKLNDITRVLILPQSTIENSEIYVPLSKIGYVSAK